LSNTPDTDVPALHLGSLSGSGAAIRTIKYLRGAERDGRTAIIDFGDCHPIYPNGAAPVASILHLFRDRGLSIELRNLQGFAQYVHIDEPWLATPSNLSRASACWNVVWRYDHGDQVFVLAKSLIEDIIERIEFGRGVLEALSWCLYEVLDNVLIHAHSANGGFAMVQYLKATKRLAVSIADTGIGIHRSFFEGKGGFRPPTAADALELAVRQWTSSTGEKRGNGLFGLSQVVQSNDGTLDLSSGRAILHRAKTNQYTSQVSQGDTLVIDADHHCTIVDFQLSIGNPIDISSLLGGAFIYNHEIEPLMNDNGAVVVKIADYATKVATRDGAIGLRVRLFNYLGEGAPHVSLDFTGVGIISSSFADETIGMLAQHYGLAEFRRLFSFQNVSDVNKVLLDRAIAARTS
jgi:anti-sigma regulatory factor (Ser/Thr protein kinase)